MEFYYRLVADVSIALVGTFINILAIVSIVNGRLLNNKTFTFVLVLFISNLLMYSICGPLSIASYILSCDRTDVLCPYSGFVIFSISGISLWNLSIISINRYVLICHSSYYDTVFTKTNTKIILLITWLFPPIVYLFPLTATWGSFMYDEKKCLCTPLITNVAFRTYSLVSTTLIPFLPISFCYLAILNKVRTSYKRITSLQIENSDRMKNHRQLIKTVLVMISIFVLINTPFTITVLLDPDQEKISPWIHSVSLYLSGISYMTNTVIYSILNKQIRTSIASIFKRIMGK